MPKIELTAKEIAAQCWCTPKTKYLTRFPDLAQAFANKLEPYLRVVEAARELVADNGDECSYRLIDALKALEEE